jgi:hypothetical protein
VDSFLNLFLPFPLSIQIVGRYCHRVREDPSVKVMDDGDQFGDYRVSETS